MAEAKVHPPVPVFVLVFVVASEPVVIDITPGVTVAAPVPGGMPVIIGIDIYIYIDMV